MPTDPVRVKHNDELVSVTNRFPVDINGVLGPNGGVQVEGVAGGVAVTTATRLIDDTGAAYGVKQINGKPRVSAMPYLYDIAEGNVSGHTPWSKLGYNGDVGVNEEDIWTVGGVYVFPTVAQQMVVASTSADDDGAPVGTGALTVAIDYLDGNHVSRTEVVTMNGVGDVTTIAVDIFRMQRMHLVTAGTGGKAAGTITLKNVAKTITYGAIAAGQTQSRNSTYTVPAGKVLYITSVTFSVHSATKGVRYTTRATYDAESALVKTFFMPYSEINMPNGVFYRPLEIPTMFPETVSLKVSAIADAAGAICAVAMRGWLEDA